jgi:hypothetical protein
MTTRRMRYNSKNDNAAVTELDSATAALGRLESGSGAEAFRDELHRIANRLDVFGRIVGNFDIEFFFESHDQLDIVQAVRAQVIDEAGLFGDLFGVSVEVLDHDLTDAFEDVGHTQ